MRFDVIHANLLIALPRANRSTVADVGRTTLDAIEQPLRLGGEESITWVRA
jgi:hypothetical protein